MVKEIFVHKVGMEELTESSCLSQTYYERFKEHFFKRDVYDPLNIVSESRSKALAVMVRLC